MIGLTDFSRILASLYGGALTSAGWAEPLSVIRRAMDATAVALSVTNRGTRHITSTADATDGYPRSCRAVGDALCAVEAGPVGVVRRGRELAGRQPRRGEIGDDLFVRLTAEPEPSCLMVAAHPGPAVFPTPERRAALHALVPHLEQALHIRDCMVGRGEAAALMDAMRNPLIVIDRDGSVVQMNDAAARLINTADGLRVRGGVVEASHPSADVDLRRCVGHVVNGGRFGASGSNTITCSRPSGRRPYIVHVLRLGASSDHASARHALLLVVDPDQTRYPPKPLMQNIFGMTQAEAEVAVRVVNGDGLKPISEELNVSLATVKTHLQHVFDKTHTHRQAELVRLLLSVAP